MVYPHDWSYSATGCAKEKRKTQQTLVKVNGVALADEGGVGNVVPYAIENVSQSKFRRAYSAGHDRVP
jgi:hypothetical protein